MLHTPSQPHSYSCTSSLSSCSSCRPTNSARALKGGTDKRIHSCVLRNSHLDVCVLTKSAKRCNGTCVWMLLTAVFNVQFPPDEPHHADCVTGRVGSGLVGSFLHSTLDGPPTRPDPTHGPLGSPTSRLDSVWSSTCPPLNLDMYGLCPRVGSGLVGSGRAFISCRFNSLRRAHRSRA